MDAAAVKTNNTAEAPPPKRNWKKILLYVGAGVIAFVVIVSVLVNTTTEEALKASNQFVDNIQASNATAAYEQFAPEAKNVVPADRFGTVVAQIGPILNTEEKVTGKEIAKETGSNATATITYEIKGTDDKTYEFIVNLKEAEGSWQILNFDSQLK